MGNIRDLEDYIGKYTHTIPLMDEFEKCEAGKKIYDRLIIKNKESINIKGREYIYNLIIERKNIYGNETEGNITLTEFKNNKGKVTQYSIRYLKKYLETKTIKEGEELYFDKPYYLRAQNSTNRSGYGWEYRWDEPIYIGTEYGECDDYLFVGIIIKNIIVNTINRKKVIDEKISSIPDPFDYEVTTYRGDKYYKIYMRNDEVFLMPYVAGLNKNEIYYEYKKLLIIHKNERKHNKC